LPGCTSLAGRVQRRGIRATDVAVRPIDHFATTPLAPNHIFDDRFAPFPSKSRFVVAVEAIDMIALQVWPEDARPIQGDLSGSGVSALEVSKVVPAGEIATDGLRAAAVADGPRILFPGLGHIVISARARGWFPIIPRQRRRRRGILCPSIVAAEQRIAKPITDRMSTPAATTTCGTQSGFASGSLWASRQAMGIQGARFRGKTAVSQVCGHSPLGPILLTASGLGQIRRCGMFGLDAETCRKTAR
jgi:hypothetical protein